MLYMHVCKQMILTIFIIAIALGAETELQLRIGFLCPSADRTFVSCDLRRILYLPFEFLSSLHLLW